MRPCFRCGCEKDRHEDGAGRCSCGKCHRFMRWKKRWAFMRLITCPFHVHHRRIMVLVEISGDTERFQCPRCKFQRSERNERRITEK